MYRSIAFSPVSWYLSSVDGVHFEWDEQKNKQNQKKHGVPFTLAQYAFGDPYGKVGDGILTVRFTYRKNSIRIIGAGYWRKGKGIYEKEHQIH